MKKVSVIIPCYNAVAWLDRCLTSVIGQTMGVESLEIICIDDASTDDTWICLQKWEKRFPDSVLLIRLEENGKLGRVRNIGLQYASAKWIAFVDADDWLEPDYFERLYEPVTKFQLDVVSCKSIRDRSDSLTYFDADRRGKKEEKYLVADTEEKTKELLVSAALGPAAWGKIIRKSLLMDAQLFFPEGLVYEDLYWSPLLLIYAKSIYMIEENLYHYFLNPHSITLSRNVDHQMDWIKVQLIKWSDYAKRGILQTYYDELAFDSLRNAADFIKLLIFRYDRPPFSLFQMEQEIMRERVPDYKENIYIAEIGELSCLLLSVLYSLIDETGFLQIVEEIKRHWTDHLLS